MKTLLFIMMLAATLQAKAGDNDTLRINKPGNVTIITGDSLQKICTATPSSWSTPIT